MPLIPRQPYTPDQRLPRIEKPWRRWLEDDEQRFLTDNQLSIWLAEGRAGCERIHFYPLPFPHRFTRGIWDFDELANHDSLRSIGPQLDIPLKQVNLRFRPYRIDRLLVGDDVTVRERCAVSGNTLILMWDLDGPDETTLHFALPYFSARVEQTATGILISVRDQVFVSIALAGVTRTSWQASEAPLECRARISPTPGERLVLALTCGYQRGEVLEGAAAAAGGPERVFDSAEDSWDEYFSRAVPYFACSDRELERLYYYQAYVTRANLYDIPYEPFTHPYTCPWKTGAVWQWSWNTPMSSIAERWLNDKRIGAGGILLEGANGGALNLGSYLHPLRKVTQARHHNDHMRLISAAARELPTDYDLITYTTLPHTMPGGLLGIWEFFLTTGERGFLREALQIMIGAEHNFSKGELPNGLCTCFFVDEFDYSLRLRPFIRDFAKGDPRMMFRMDSPFVAVDYNSYLFALRGVIIKAAKLLGDDGVDIASLHERNARLAEAINRYLWDDDEGFYYDAHSRTLQRSDVKCIAGFAPLYAGLASEVQAARLVEHLTDPDEFGTPYPCPSISLDTPDVDPSLITYGGDVLLTSGLWFTVEGLRRYGYRELAADYVRRALRMVTSEGPSSSYSYHSITGRYNQAKHTLAAQSVILTDLICRYIIGLHPQPHGALLTDPLALQRSGITEFKFGPFLYCGRWIKVRWNRKRGYHLEETPLEHGEEDHG